MKLEQEDLTNTITQQEEKMLVSTITGKYDKFEDSRMAQLSDIKAIREAIYDATIPQVNAWAAKCNCLKFTSYHKP